MAYNSQLDVHFVLQLFINMQKYTKVKVIRITEIQYKTLKKMKELNVDVGRFVIDAISEKLEREKIEILKPKKEKCPF